MSKLLAMWQTFASAAAGALDPYTTNLWATWSLDRELSAYTGPLIRVRRSSDNTEQDIGTATGTSLDTASLLAFAGSGSAYVSKVYDQGGVNDLVMATDGNQPQIVSAGSYLGFIAHDGTDDFMATPNNVPGHAALTMYCRLTLGSNSVRQMLMLCDLGDGSDINHGAILFDWNAASGGGYRNALLNNSSAGVIVNQFNTSSTTSTVVCDVFDFSKSSNPDRVPVYINGSITSPSIATGGSIATTVVMDAAPINVGATGTGATPSTMHWTKMVIYDDGHLASTVAAISAVL